MIEDVEGWQILADILAQTSPEERFGLASGVSSVGLAVANTVSAGPDEPGRPVAFSGIAD